MIPSRPLFPSPESLSAELEQLRTLTAQFQSGALAPARYQAFRVPQGIYEQRESGTFMLRARLAAGILFPDQMRVAAGVAREFGEGPLHLTSRQDLQVHGVRPEGIHAAVVRLTDAGLSSKGGGGNTVRNIAGCERAGVCADELFDVTPHVLGLTGALLADPLSFQLPRKYKISFSGCSRDCAGATVNDLGLIARTREGVEGFAVYVGGGMGAISAVGRLLEPFVPADRVRAVAEAVKRVFDRHGNRKNKHRARLRFLIEDLGFERFIELYRQEFASLDSAFPPAQLPPVAVPARASAPAVPAPGFEAWKHDSIQPQKQPGYFVAEIAPPLGNLTADALEGLADVIAGHGEGMLRSTNRQSLVLRWLREEELPSLHAGLAALGLATPGRAALKNLVVCAGAATCRLGICLSRGLASAIREAIETTSADLRVHISGCPNSCGRHPVADIGLVGAARRIEGKLAPYYVVQLGGHVEEGKTVLASGSILVPARRVPAFLKEFLGAFAASPRHPDFRAFLETGGRTLAESLAARLAAPPDTPEFYHDWGAAEPFTLAGRGPAECGAGVFDLIALDLSSARTSLKENRLLAATIAAARALLPTRGEEAATDLEALDRFRHHFVNQELVPADLAGLVDRAAAACGPEASQRVSDDEAAEVARLMRSVEELYQAMGPSLKL